MATMADVYAILSRLDGVTLDPAELPLADGEGMGAGVEWTGPRGGVKKKGLVWSWNERAEPTQPRRPRPDVLAIMVADLAEKEALLCEHPDVIFTEPHYDGFTAVLVRLPKASKKLLTELITDAYRSYGPPREP